MKPERRAGLFPRPTGVGLLVAVAVALSLPATAQAIPVVHAHRGGSVIEGKPTFPENTMPAFEHAAAQQYVLELDVKLTADDVPVVIHDDTPDRTTTCKQAKRVRDYTLAKLQGCHADVLGSPGSGLATAPIANPSVAPPTLAEVLALARRTRSRVNLEIKNLPTDNDYDPSGAYARKILAAVDASGLPLSSLIVQSFDPANLEVADQVLPGVETSLLTLAASNDGGPALARSREYEWVSPGFPVSQAYVSEAHAAGRRVVPYTLDTPEQVRAGAALGIDELITDDPAMARRVLAEVEPPAPAIPAPPTAAQCERTRAGRRLPPIESYASGSDAPRVFAMQFKQELRHVVSYPDFRTKIECMVRELVVPRLAKGRPNVIAFNEDVGLMTIATGTRGAVARGAFGGKGSPGCESAGVPCTTLGALGAVGAAYAPQEAAYRVRFGPQTPVSDPFVAATDTFGRGWMQVFSDIARRYGVYILGSNNQSRFRESTDPAEVELFRDPDLPRPRSVFVATGDDVFNEVFIWGPHDARPDGPRPLRNVVASNKKVPLTPIEEQLQLAPGPATGSDAVPNVAPYSLPGTKARIGFATSLPAFVYGDPPQGTDPCSDTARYYMRCLDRLGVNLVIQDEANPGRWAANGGSNYWQPLEWMRSTWRAASDPGVGFDYNVTPHMVGNLADLAFDGQTAITQRGLGAGRTGAARCTYVGNERFVAGEDPESARADAGLKPEFLAIVPWVNNGPRPKLRSTAAQLAPGSGDDLENDYAETAIAADLPFPPHPSRPACATGKAAAVPVAQHRPGGNERGPGARPGPRDGHKRAAAGRGAAAVTGAAGGLPFTGLELALVGAAGVALLCAGLGTRRRLHRPRTL